jgi:hypothetical protein
VGEFGRFAITGIPTLWSQNRKPLRHHAIKELIGIDADQLDAKASKDFAGETQAYDPNTFGHKKEQGAEV